MLRRPLGCHRRPRGGLRAGYVHLGRSPGTSCWSLLESPNDRIELPAAAIAEPLAVTRARPVNGNGLVRRSLLSYGAIVTCRAPPATFFLQFCSKRSSVMTAPC